ncbi:hypothetical protein CLV97_10174 [Planifilum fimeticola]|jgi:hypothetical protein|uniref:Uncharacterized protein n=1 Tax=Planifilum fimeticola TaxID=201975 RepID=A0A2T0LJ89_9BACL|nr:hypothetical protein [Planifilum fimeticola]PRX42586.1 hypothetical protein CLV97_10174 [Planifilum fimeticola]
METVGWVCLVAGVILLFMAKGALGNRDGHFVDGWIEARRTGEDRKRNGRRSLIYFLLGLGLVAMGVVLV